MNKFVLALASVISIFSFPLWLTITLATVTSFFIPFFALYIGIIFDSIYGFIGGVPLGTCAGGLLSVLVIAGKKVLSARIMHI